MATELERQLQCRLDVVRNERNLFEDRAVAAEAERDALREALVHVRGLLPHIAYEDGQTQRIQTGNQAHDVIEAAFAAPVSKEAT